MSPQSSIAHYRITAKLGAGGMGEVWRATDTKLNRDVAIKVLPEAFAQDPDRMARFTREARVLASLNHPNIAAIYGVEERALVMELYTAPERVGATGTEIRHRGGLVDQFLLQLHLRLLPLQRAAQAFADFFDSTGKTWLLHLTGGEPFAYRGFVELCAALTRNHLLSLNSNVTSRAGTGFRSDRRSTARRVYSLWRPSRRA